MSTETTAPAASPFSSRISGAQHRLLAFSGLIVLVVIFSLASPNFLQTGNIITILQATSVNGVLAIAATIVIISGGIDLSVGTLMTFCAVVAGVARSDTPAEPAPATYRWAATGSGVGDAAGDAAGEDDGAAAGRGTGGSVDFATGAAVGTIGGGCALSTPANLE